MRALIRMRAKASPAKKRFATLSNWIGLTATSLHGVISPLGSIAQSPLGDEDEDGLLGACAGASGVLADSLGTISSLVTL